MYVAEPLHALHGGGTLEVCTLLRRTLQHALRRLPALGEMKYLYPRCVWVVLQLWKAESMVRGRIESLTDTLQ